MTLTTVAPTIPAGYLTSAGRGVRIVVQARCTCRWAGPSPAWSADCLTAENEDLDRHCYDSRHQVLDQDDPAGPVHSRCAHVHDRHNDCPVPYDSPVGLLARTVRSSLTSSEAATDRLQAVSRLADWVAKQQLEAVIGARLAGLDWAQLAHAAGITETDAQDRWGGLIGRPRAVGRTPWRPRSMATGRPLDGLSGATARGRR